jgi:hypothetical protein
VRRPKAQVLEESKVSPSCPELATRPAATAEATNSMPTNSNPLPRKTVAKNRSSASPTRSRKTPTNQRNAIPAKGTRPRASRTASRRELSESHRPASAGSAGTAVRTRTRATAKRTENAIPARAADRGVLIARPTGLVSAVVTGVGLTATSIAPIPHVHSGEPRLPKDRQHDRTRTDTTTTRSLTRICSFTPTG